jgi:two-component system nitrogen regulation response regulator NtrX
MTPHEHLLDSGLFGESLLMLEVLSQIDKASASRAGVMVSGEPGTGRGLVARAIHACAQANGAPFVAVYCSTLLPAEAERLLFGLPRNGNSQPRPARGREVVYPGSLLHDALGGTIYFRNVEELPTRVQARLAALFRDREFQARPRSEAIPFTARPIAAVDLDFRSHVDEGRVRVDLYRRFAEFQIVVPALRDRREDIPALAQCFVTRACRSQAIADKTLDSAAQAILEAMPWHGNFRELQALLEGLVLRTADTTITLHALLEHVQVDSADGPHVGLGAPLREARQRFEREYIAAVVAQHHGRIPDAARSLGIQRTNLYRKLRELRMAKPDGGLVAKPNGGRVFRPGVPLNGARGL